MTTLRAPWRLLRAACHLVLGSLVMLAFPLLDANARRRCIRWWAAGLLRAFGLTLQVSGTARGPVDSSGVMLVANHVSWLDILAIHAAAPQARFVAKADMRRWPLIGWLARGAGTLFIEREKKRDAVRVVHAVAAALQRGETVAVFPEGTTGEGPEPLPFHANLLQAAVATGTAVQPVALRFSDAASRFSGAVAFVGETTLLYSVWRVATARGLGVHVDWLPPIDVTPQADRRQLAQRLRDAIAARLRGAVPPFPLAGEGGG